MSSSGVPCERLVRLLGEPILQTRSVLGGYTPAHRWIARTATRSVFVKMASTAGSARQLRNEANFYSSVRGSFLPEFIAWEDDEHAPLLLIEDLSRAVWPPPWSPARVDAVLQQLERVHRTPAEIASFTERHQPEPASGWSVVAVDPLPLLALGLVDERWLAAALPHLGAAAGRCELTGTALMHMDVRSDNVCITANGVKFVDWAEACLGNPELDLAFWLPSLAAEGGPLPEAVLPDAPEIAAWVCGFFAARAGLPGIPDAPRVRAVQLAQLATALPWASRALDLPLPTSGPTGTDGLDHWRL